MVINSACQSNGIFENLWGIVHSSNRLVFQVVPGLPKTRSGKIMRRILRKVAQDKPDELGDVSTLADPSVVEVIVRQHGEVMERVRKNQPK